MSIQDLAESLMATCAQSRLHEYSVLGHAYVIPIEALGKDARRLWTEDDREFSRRLGACASAYLECELRNRSTFLATKRKEKEYDQYEIGVAGGATISAAVANLERFELPRSVRITPLVLGPVPEMHSAAGTVADVLSQKITNSVVADLTEVKIGQRESKTTGHIIDVFQVSPKQGVIAEIDGCDFDWVLVGVGAPGTESFDTAAKKIGATPATLREAEGDVCSRFFNCKCEEVMKEQMRAFVMVSLDRLQKLAWKSHRCRVVAFAGGHKKVKALRTLLHVDECVNEPLFREEYRAVPGRIITTLITDELTALAIADSED